MGKEKTMKKILLLMALTCHVVAKENCFWAEPAKCAVQAIKDADRCRAMEKEHSRDKKQYVTFAGKKEQVYTWGCFSVACMSIQNYCDDVSLCITQEGHARYEVSTSTDQYQLDWETAGGAGKAPAPSRRKGIW